MNNKPAIIGDFLWQAMPDGNEKRQAYYCSREWGLKKKAVHERSGGLCERCRINSGEAVHHASYAHLYREPVEELILLCSMCHDFTHGHSNDDPLAERKARLALDHGLSKMISEDYVDTFGHGQTNLQCPA